MDSDVPRANQSPSTDISDEISFDEFSFFRRSTMLPVILNQTIDDVILNQTIDDDVVYVSSNNRPRANQSVADISDQINFNESFSFFSRSPMLPRVRLNQTRDDDVIYVSPNKSPIFNSNISIVDLCTPINPYYANRRRRNLIENETIEIDSSFVEPQPKTRIDTPSLNKLSSNLSKNLKFNDNSQNALKCPICFELIIGRKPMATKCGHVFCKKCLKEVLKRKNKCPICMRKCNKENVFELFI